MARAPSTREAQAVVWRNIPNAISAARLAAVPLLLLLVVGKRREPFPWLLLACYLSDILDGLIARGFRLRSQFGAFLDSTADLLVSFIALASLAVFQWGFLTAYYRELFVVVGLHLGEMGVSLWRYGRISSFHTILNRIAAYSQGIFVMSLFFWGYHGWIFQAAIGLTIFAFAEEFLLLYFLPKWRADVPGVYWILTERSAATE